MFVNNFDFCIHEQMIQETLEEVVILQNMKSFSAGTMDHTRKYSANNELLYFEMFPHFYHEVTNVEGLMTRLYRHEMDCDYEFSEDYMPTSNLEYWFSRVIIDILASFDDQTHAEY